MKVGDYAMLGEHLVRISEQLSPGQFGVTYIDTDGSPCGGSYSWSAEQLSPLMNVDEILRSEIFEADRLARDHKRCLAEQEFEARMLRAALAAVRVSEDASKAAVEAAEETLSE